MSVCTKRTLARIFSGLLILRNTNMVINIDSQTAHTISAMAMIVLVVWAFAYSQTH